MKNKKIAIIGLGLIGGSLARALNKKAGIKDITAIDTCKHYIKQAIAEGVISRGYSNLEQWDFCADIVFLCTPVKYTLTYISSIAGRLSPDCIITDACSTKGEIVSYVNSMPTPPCYIGGHPMAGSEKAGYSAGSAHLFENAYYMLTPSKSTTKAALDCIIEVITSIGGLPVVLDSSEHDKITAGISHVPHVIAAALVNMVREMDTASGKMQMLAAGGFKDITRIASSNPEVWESIIMSNKNHVMDILNCFIHKLQSFNGFIEKSNSKQIYDFFETSRSYRNSFSSARKGLIDPINEIIVDVVDKPGIIGQIAALLGNKGVNIKNINVSNSREFEQGCLRITLPDSFSSEQAFKLLADNGYKVYKAC